MVASKRFLACQDCANAKAAYGSFQIRESKWKKFSAGIISWELSRVPIDKFSGEMQKCREETGLGTMVRVAVDAECSSKTAGVVSRICQLVMCGKRLALRAMWSVRTIFLRGKK